MAITLGRNGYTQYGSSGSPDCYPKSTALAASELRCRGFEATVPTLSYLVKLGTVEPKRDGRSYAWTPSDIDRAAAYFEDKEAYSAFGHTNQMLGIDAEQYHRALRLAMDEVRERYGEQAVPTNDIAEWFVMHVHPPRVSWDGYVTFTLCDDVAAELEQQAAAMEDVRPIRERKLLRSAK